MKFLRAAGEENLTGAQMSCPFCKRVMDKLGSYEFTLKFILNVYDFYHANNLSSNNDEIRFVDERIPMYQIFNHENELNKDIPKTSENENLDENDEENAQSKSKNHLQSCLTPFM